MIKTYLYRSILVIVIISSILGISKQLGLLLNARQQIHSLEQKISTLTNRNSNLNQAINPQ